MWRNNTPGVSVMSYIFGLDDEHLRFIKHHASYLGGLWPHCYANQDVNIEHNRDINIYKSITEDIDPEYHISEPIVDGADWPFGYMYNDKMINNDTLRYQEAVSNLVRSGVLDELKQIKKRKLFIEIGSGVGGLAIHLQRFVPNTTYVFCDVPYVLFMGGVYTVFNRPDAKIYVYNPDTFSPDFFKENYEKYDFMLLPFFVRQALTTVNHQLLINLLSFQEMSSSQIEEYASLARKHCDGFVYSANWSRHPSNKYIGDDTVEEVLGRGLRLYPNIEYYREPPISERFWDPTIFEQPVKVFVGRSRDLNENTYENFRLWAGYDAVKLDGAARL